MTDPIEDQLIAHLADRADEATLSFGVDDVIAAAGRPRSDRPGGSHRWWYNAVAAAVLVGGLGSGLWALGQPLDEPDPTAPASSVDAAAPQDDQRQPIDERIDELARSGGLLPLYPSQGPPSGEAAVWLAPGLSTLEAGRLGRLFVGSPTPSPASDWEAEPTAASVCVAIVQAVGCGPLVDATTGEAVTRAAGNVNGPAMLSEHEGQAVILVSATGPNGAWLLITGLSPSAALVEMAAGDTIVGQVPVSGSAALPHSIGAPELMVTVYDAGGSILWTDNVEPEYPAGSTDAAAETPSSPADGYDAEAIDSSDYRGLVPPPATLGPDWTEFGMVSAAGLVLSAPEPDACPSAPEIADSSTTVSEGLYVEYGLGPSPDDALILVVHQASTDLAVVYDVLEATYCDKAPVAEPPVPDLPGAQRVARFVVEDDLGQIADSVLVLRDDIVLLVDVSMVEGIEQVDVNALVTRMLETYDGG